MTEPSTNLPTDDPLRKSAVALRVVDSQDLMAGQKEIGIRHGQDMYRLSVTRAGKLILRK
jgi:hemin uptake protein HemP